MYDTYVCMYVCVYIIHICMYVRMCVCNIYIYIYMRVCVCVCVCVCVDVALYGLSHQQRHDPVPLYIYINIYKFSVIYNIHPNAYKHTCNVHRHTYKHLYFFRYFYFFSLPCMVGEWRCSVEVPPWVSDVEELADNDSS